MTVYVCVDKAGDILVSKRLSINAFEEVDLANFIGQFALGRADESYAKISNYPEEAVPEVIEAGCECWRRYRDLLFKKEIEITAEYVERSVYEFFDPDYYNR